uniref:Uncharacterized protein n=1 Tax=Oryza sativa subsp. japonica TaxID=39947 RepID=Q6Z639_ORYSJ|nr:hypothetical protein [Oryza sativa Japonica Group]
MVGCGCMVLLVVPIAIKDRFAGCPGRTYRAYHKPAWATARLVVLLSFSRRTQARVGVMELGRSGCPVDRLPDSPRHERGAARCLLGTGANPKPCTRLWAVDQIHRD